VARREPSSFPRAMASWYRSIYRYRSISPYPYIDLDGSISIHIAIYLKISLSLYIYMDLYLYMAERWRVGRLPLSFVRWPASIIYLYLSIFLSIYISVYLGLIHRHNRPRGRRAERWRLIYIHTYLYRYIDLYIPIYILMDLYPYISLYIYIYIYISIYLNGSNLYMAQGRRVGSLSLSLARWPVGIHLFIAIDLYLYIPI